MTSLRRVRTATSAEWDRAFRACEHASWFQSRGWAELWTAQRLKPRPIRVEFSDGRSAVVPGSAPGPLGGFLRVRRMPAGSYGGWLSETPLERGHVRALAGLLARRDIDFRLCPLTPHLDEDTLPVAGRDHTHMLDLRTGKDAVLRGFSKGHRSAAQKAAREGVVISAAGGAAGGAADWEAYRSLVAETRARWRAPQGPSLDPAILRGLSAPAVRGVTLWLARRGSQVLAGALCLYARRHVAYWHGAAATATLPLRPVHLLMREIITDAIHRGLHWYDFNPSGGLEGVERFKRGFGAEVWPVPILKSRSGAGRAVGRARGWLAPSPSPRD